MAIRGDNSLYFATGLDTSGLQAGHNEALSIINSMTSQISRINPFAALAVGAAAAFAKVASDAYRMMKDFETAMTAVKTIANVSEEEFKALENQVFDLYKQLGTETPDALARGLYDIIGSGYEAADALVLLEVASKAATAGITSSEVAADGLTTILNSFQLEAKDAAFVADIMFATVDRGKISFEELSSQIAQVAPLAAQSGFSFEEIGGAIATLTKQGVPASQAMTQIRSAIVSTNEVMGANIAETLSLQAAFQAMYDAAEGDQNKLKDLAGRIEAVNAILGIAGPNFEGATEDMLAMANAAGSVDRSFEMITGTTENQWSILGQRIKATTRDIGQSMLEMSNSFAGYVNRMLERSEDLVADTRASANEFRILRTTLEDVNTPLDEKRKILQQLKDQYPEYLESLDLDRVKNDNLEQTLKNVAGALELINDEQERRLRLAGASQRELEAQAQRDTYQELVNQAKTDFFSILEEIKEYAASENIELNFSMSDDIQKIYRDIDRSIDAGPFSSGGRLLANLNQARNSVSVFAGHLHDANRELQEVTKNTQETRRAIYDNAEGYKQIVREIENINDIQDLSQYDNFTNENIRKALAERRGLLTQLLAIDNTSDIESLKPFLDSEIQEIQDYAQKRARLLNRGAQARLDGGEDLEDQAKAFRDFLKKREEDYRAYQAVINQIGKEQADEQFQNLLQEGGDYQEFLNNQLKATRDFAKQRDIALAAENAGINLRRELLQPVNELTQITEKINLDGYRESIKYIQGQLDRLREQFREADAAGREALRPEIEMWKKRLEEAERGAQDEENIYRNLRRGLEDLNRSQLRDYIRYWQERLNAAKAGSNAEREAQDNIESARRTITNLTTDSIRNVGQSLSEASSMFRKFGEEDLADMLDKLSAVGNGVTSVIQGIAQGGPLGMLQVAGGVFNAIGSLISGGNRNQKSEFELSLERLSRSVDRLNHSLYQVYGQESIRMRQQIIEKTEEEIALHKQRFEEFQKLLEMSEKADGIIGRVASDAFRDLVGMSEEAFMEAKEELRSFMEEYRELLTGTTQQSLTDSILQGIREGKKGIEDFAETFEETMQNALLRTFQTQYLDQQMSEFYKRFAELGEDGRYDASDMSQLQRMWEQMVSGTSAQVDAINDILKNAGLGAIGQGQDQRAQGLSGAIASITEDTANVLAGTLTGMALDIRRSLTVSEQSLTHLAEIATNTRYNRYLENIDRNITSLDGRISTIESGIQNFGAQG